MTKVRVLIADDHPLIREAIGQLVRATPDFQVVGEAADGRECLKCVQELLPDILLLDIAMPEINGEEVARAVAGISPATKILVLSGFTDPQFVRATIKAGVSGYVVKSASGRELIRALKAVLAGKNYLSPEVAGALMRAWDDRGSGSGQPRLEVLGAREKEVLKLIAEGNRNAAIASRLGIAVGTVDAHRRNIMRKLRLHSATELTRYAIRNGVVAP